MPPAIDQKLLRQVAGLLAMGCDLDTITEAVGKPEQTVRDYTRRISDIDMIDNLPEGVRVSPVVNVLAKISPGQAVTYHTGSLANDRVGNGEVEAVARAAIRAQDEGRARLYQTRFGNGRFAYVAVGKSTDMVGAW